MNHRLAVLVSVLAGGLAPIAPGEPPPKPSVIPVSWELDFSFETPRMITLKLPGEQRVQRYWYMLYKITNRTDKDQIFVPDFLLYTDTGQILRGGERIPAAVFQEIQKLHNNPLLVDIAAITGRILQGEDNARESAAIWRDFDPQARAFDVFVGGLSGERARVTLPAPVRVLVAQEGGGKVEVTQAELLLAKTLLLSYSLPGEAAARDRTEPELLRREWVMR